MTVIEILLSILGRTEEVATVPAIYAYDGMTHNLIWKNPIPTDVIYQWCCVWRCG